MADIIRMNRDFLRYCVDGIDRQAETFSRKPHSTAQLTAASLLRQAAESIRAALRTTASAGERSALVGSELMMDPPCVTVHWTDIEMWRSVAGSKEFEQLRDAGATARWLAVLKRGGARALGLGGIQARVKEDFGVLATGLDDELICVGGTARPGPIAIDWVGFSEDAVS